MCAPVHWASSDQSPQSFSPSHFHHVGIQRPFLHSYWKYLEQPGTSVGAAATHRAPVCIRYCCADRTVQKNQQENKCNVSVVHSVCLCTQAVFPTWLRHKHKTCWVFPPHRSWPHQSNPRSHPCRHTSIPGSHTLRWHTGRCRRHTLFQTRLAWLKENRHNIKRRCLQWIWILLDHFLPQPPLFPFCFCLICLSVYVYL